MADALFWHLLWYLFLPALRVDYANYSIYLSAAMEDVLLAFTDTSHLDYTAWQPYSILLGTLGELPRCGVVNRRQCELLRTTD